MGSRVLGFWGKKNDLATEQIGNDMYMVEQDILGKIICEAEH